MEEISLEAVVSDGNCQMFPLNFQRVFKYKSYGPFSQTCSSFTRSRNDADMFLPLTLQSKWVVISTCFNIKKLHSPTENIFIFRMIMGIKSDHYPKQH